MEEYIVILDTNILRIKEEGDLSIIFNNKIKDLKKFLEDEEIKNIEVCIPELVVEERIQQRLEQAIQVKRELDKAVNSFKKLDTNIKTSNLNQELIRSKLKEFSSSFVRENKLRIIPIPKIDYNILVKRAIQRICPFNGKDKGFKDTLLWLSILSDSKTTNKNYILLTENLSDFKEEELIPQFKGISKKKFKICESIENLKNYLDKELRLNLEIEENIKKFEKIIKTHWEEIKEKILEKKYSYNRSRIISFEDSDIVQDFILKEIKIKNISPHLDGKIFSLDISIKVIPKIKSKIFTPYEVYVRPISFFNEEECIIEMELDYSQELNKINKITKINPDKCLYQKPRPLFGNPSVIDFTKSSPYRVNLGDSIF